MKKITLILFVITLFVITGCDKGKKNLYLPEANNDKVYTTVGGNDEKMQTAQAENALHKGNGYTISVPTKGYRYEKDYDDGNLEEKWDYIKKEDVELKVTTYKNTDEITARSRFLKDNEDYIFEDLMGYPLCGMELDGDTLWFDLCESDGTVYIISWEFPKNTNKDLQKELSDIAETFNLAE